MELWPLVLTAASVGITGITLYFRDRQWQQFCRDMYAQALAHGHNPAPEVMIRAARKGRPGPRLPDQLSLPAKPRTKPPPANDSG
jgi:hypothetical protein